MPLRLLCVCVDKQTLRCLGPWRPTDVPLGGVTSALVRRWNTFDNLSSGERPICALRACNLTWLCCFAVINLCISSFTQLMSWFSLFSLWSSSLAANSFIWHRREMWRSSSSLQHRQYWISLWVSCTYLQDVYDEAPQKPEAETGDLRGKHWGKRNESRCFVDLQTSVLNWGQRWLTTSLTLICSWYCTIT